MLPDLLLLKIVLFMLSYCLVLVLPHAAFVYWNATCVARKWHPRIQQYYPLCFVVLAQLLLFPLVNHQHTDLLGMLLLFLRFQRHVSGDNFQVFFPEKIVIDLNWILPSWISVLELLAFLDPKSNGSIVHLYCSLLFVFAEILASNHLY